MLVGGALGLGWGPFPSLGMPGVAAGQVVANGLGAAFLYGYLRSGRARVRLRLRATPLQRSLLHDILKVGAFACISPLQTVLTILILTRLVAQFGDMGDRIFRLARGADKAQRLGDVGQLGADAGINYRSTPEWAKATRDITAGRVSPPSMLAHWRGNIAQTLGSVLARSAAGVTVEVAIRDSGIGIAPENQTRIFSGFTQAEASTTRRFGRSEEHTSELQSR